MYTKLKKYSLIVETKCKGLLNKTAEPNIAIQGKILSKKIDELMMDGSVNASI